jgi:hypothetical protein
VKAEELKDLQLVEALDEQYLSDLLPQDIPDDCVSDVESNLMTALEDPKGASSNALFSTQAEIEKEATR